MRRLSTHECLRVLDLSFEILAQLFVNLGLFDYSGVEFLYVRFRLAHSKVFIHFCLSFYVFFFNHGGKMCLELLKLHPLSLHNILSLFLLFKAVLCSFLNLIGSLLVNGPHMFLYLVKLYSFFLLKV